MDDAGEGAFLGVGGEDGVALDGGGVCGDLVCLGEDGDEALAPCAGWEGCEAGGGEILGERWGALGWIS